MVRAALIYNEEREASRRGDRAAIAAASPQE